MRILLVEDDRMIGAALEQALRDAAYAVDRVGDAARAAAALRLESYDLVLLDLGLPDSDGTEVLKSLRDRGLDVPVLIVSARDAIESRIGGLDLGADDYLVKPFQVSELLARIRAALRRRGGSASPIMGNGRLELDPASHEGRFGDVACRLSAREFALLQALLVRPGAILSRAELESRIYGWGEEIESNMVEVLIHSIRKKLGAESIRNLRGVGWMVDRPG
ncbi:MAG TPA: response regulator [Caldimonas sp.]|jgi:two-component system OmpR family response regulator|nr:response regulator [Caldimonas sp.]HEV7577915.1 response regulator [Caldimonas sp.]